MSWPLWRADNPAGLLLFVQPDEVARRLPGLPARAEGRGENPRERVETIYAAFAGARVRYADEPIARAGGGQLIRPPDEIFQIPRHGNCLDLSVAFAGACLAAGVHPLIVVCEPAGGGVAHAVVVVWLRGQWTGIGGHRDYLPPGGDQSVLTAPPLWPDGGLRGSVDDMGGFLPIDITRVSVGYGPDGASFAEAVGSAASLLTAAATDTGGCRWQFGVDVGRFYDQRSALAPPGQPRVPALEAPYQIPAAAGNGPLAQLRARNTVVSFQSRRELDLLLGWCRAPAGEPAKQLVGADEVTEPLRIAVVEGIGGAGKTHLAAELAHRLAGDGWHTGFLTAPPAADGQSWLVRLASPLLVVIDYVERWPTEALLDLLRELATRRRRTAVLFTARFRAYWWSKLDTELTRTGVPRQVFPQLRLDACHPDAARLFNRAYRRFADTSEAVDDPDDPVDTGRWTTLELVMLAWLAARTDATRPASHTDLFNEIIKRELGHWADTIKNRFDDRPAIDGLRLAAAHVSLLSPTRRQLTTVLRQAGIADYTHLAPAQLVEGLAQLAGDGHDTLALRPDPVAEHLILDTFPADPTQYAVAVDSLPAHEDPHVVTAVFDDAAGRFCDNLTRTAERSPAAREAATRLARTALTRQVTLWPQAFAVALHRGGPFVTPLTDLAERDDNPLPLHQLNATIPLRHTELRRLALIASTRTMPPPPDDDTDEHHIAQWAAALATLATRQSDIGHPEALASTSQASAAYGRLAEANPGAYLPDLAASLNNLGIMLSNLGRREEALTPSQSTATIYRRLAEANPGAYLPDLAMSLNNLGTMLSNLGRREEALTPSQDAATIRRRLAEANPGAYLPDLAMSLNNLGAMLSNLGRREEALTPSQDAVTIYRRLAEANPGAYLPDLAMSLNNLGAMLSNLGRREEALTPSQDAATIYRRLAEANPGAYLPDLAMSLNNLGIRLSNLGRREEALTPSQEAATIRRRLAEANPGAYLPDLAMSLNNLGIRLSDLGRREEALTPSQDAVTIYRRLAEANPGAYLPDLAMSLNNLGAMLSNLGRREEALTPSQDAATIYRRLAEANPGAYLPDLAMSLNNLGAMLSNLGRREEALTPSQDAATIYRRLAEANPGAYLPDLAMSLNNLGIRLSNLGRREEALTPSQDATTIRRRLAEANPGAYLPDLAMSLNNLGAMLSDLGRREEALTPSQEAATIRRRLAEANPGAYLPDLAASLNNLGIRLSDLGRREEALTPSQEAATIRRRLAEANPGAYLPDLAASLNNLGIRLSDLGRREEALTPSQEAATIRRRLAEANPGAYLPDLAASLNNLGIRLSNLGRREEALTPSQEAATIYRRLAEANPGAYLPDLAMSLNNLGTMLSNLGRREEALTPSQEAATIRRRLAEANPGAYLPDLARSLNNLGAMLSDLGRRKRAVTAFHEAGENMDPGPRAELDLALARWRARQHDPEADIVSDIIRAADRADHEDHPQRGARARRAVRAAIAELQPDNPPAGVAMWATAPLPDATLTLLNRVLAQASWAERATVLRSPAAMAIRDPSAQHTRAILAALYSDNPTLVHLLHVLDTADEHGLDAVLEALQATEEHQALVRGWLETPNWSASRRFLRQHPRLLADPRTVETLGAAAGDPTVRQHLAMARLAATMPIDTVYDIVLDVSEAIDAAIAAIDNAELDQLAEVWFAAPALSRNPFIGPYLAAILTARHSDGADQALDLIRMAAEHGDEDTRTTAATRLSALAIRIPELAALLRDLAGLLTAQSADGRRTATDQDSIT